MSRLPSRIRYDILAARVGEILHWDWDPIGVAGVPQARDEYDSYVPLVVKMLIEGKKKEVLRRLLWVKSECPDPIFDPLLRENIGWRGEFLFSWPD